MTSSFTIRAHGPFDLRRSIDFLEEWPAGQAADDRRALRYATCGEDGWSPVGIVATSTDDGVRVGTTRPAGAVLRRQVERTISLDADASGFADVGRRDPVVGRLQAARPGLRPVLFWSPWEAAVWAVLSQRTSMRQASALKRRIAGGRRDAVLRR